MGTHLRPCLVVCLALAGCQTEVCPPGVSDSIFCRSFADASLGDACVPHAPCSPPDDRCATGYTICTAAGPICEVTGRLPEGAPCGDGYTCGADGTCTVCTPGLICNTNNPCTMGHIDCGSGRPVCVPDVPVDGMPCGTSGTCSRGLCSECIEDTVCRTDDPCTIGRTRCLDASTTVCEPDSELPPGVGCGPGLACSDRGECEDCIEGGICNTGNPCTTGRIDCGSGMPVCVEGEPVPGMLCGTSGVCRDTGECSECVDGIACPTGNPCTTGVVDCSSGVMECRIASTLPAGVRCGVGLACDGEGNCVECVPGDTCTTLGCQTGTIRCATGSPVCVPTGPAPAGAECRPRAHSCDVAEVCDGSGAPCPPDQLAPAGTPCIGGGTCDDAGTCVPSCVPGAPCTTSRGCEAGRVDCSTGSPVCVGIGAPQPAGTECRAAASECDAAEVCDGTALDCPADAPARAGTSCSIGVCDGAGACIACTPGAPCTPANPCEAGTLDCSGGTPVCVPSGPAPAGTLCRPAAGPCDVAETCDGTTTRCPPDGFDSTAICRPPAGPCDAPDRCDGSGAACPADAPAPAGTVCGIDRVCDGMGACVPCTDGAPCSTGRGCEIGRTDCSSGGPVCVPVGLVAAGTECRPPAGPCDVPEVCTGTSPDCPPDGMLGAGTVCRAPAGPCDAVETCDGLSPNCPVDARLPAGTVCNPSVGPCDAAEVCDGTSVGCPPDALAPAGTVCRPRADLCDAIEVCSGLDPSCPPDQTEPAGTVCRPAVDGCDVPEVCPGGTNACPSDAFAPLGTSCPAGVCDGSGGCGPCAGVCPIRPNATTTCTGVCGYTCNAGYADCNMAATDGCEVHLSTDPLHCGGCGSACPIPANASATCASSTCGYSCNPGFADCNASGADGCEIDTGNDPANCGGCGNSCPTPPNATRICASGTCSYTCNGAFADCNASATDGCEIDTGTDLAHCGACGNVCPTRPNSTRTCAGGSCGYSCDPNYGDCNGVATDGCETDLRSTVEHCGACGNPCPARANATSTCTGSTCGYTCNPGFDDCNGSAADGCERDLDNDPAHCGSCGFACPARPNASPICTSGSCGYSCNPGYADCNGDPTDGCEVFTGGDVNNCGSCGNVCPTLPASSPTCSGGTCGFACDPGFGDCNGVATDGCETSVVNNLSHCGTCGNACVDRPNSSPTCAGTTCSFTCDPGFRDCNGAAGDGCESSVFTDVDNCGGCGNACPNRPNSTRLCAGGSCDYSCNAGFGDCNGSASDGCEVNLDTNPAHCGACGRTCNLPNANERCEAGTCRVDTCVPPYFNVDGSDSNGCECRDDDWSSSCGAAEDVGDVFAGSSRSRSGKIVPAGDSDWFVVRFPASGQPGAGQPRITFSVNEGNVFRFAVRGACSGATLTCEVGNPASSTDYTFIDNEAIPGANQWNNPPTRFVPWPTIVYVEVYRTNGGDSCANYTIVFSR
ncbi:MAG TPA: hypothetical protein VIL20_31580 [Sandaracinaceae bacterium]